MADYVASFSVQTFRVFLPSGLRLGTRIFSALLHCKVRMDRRAADRRSVTYVGAAIPAPAAALSSLRSIIRACCLAAIQSTACFAFAALSLAACRCLVSIPLPSACIAGRRLGFFAFVGVVSPCPSFFYVRPPEEALKMEIFNQEFRYRRDFLCCSCSPFRGSASVRSSDHSFSEQSRLSSTWASRKSESTGTDDR